MSSMMAMSVTAIDEDVTTTGEVATVEDAGSDQDAGITPFAICPPHDIRNVYMYTISDGTSTHRYLSETVNGVPIYKNCTYSKYREFYQRLCSNCDLDQGTSASSRTSGHSCGQT